MSLEDYNNYLVNNVGVNEEVINCITGINGYNKKTLDSVLYYYTGYRDLEQFLECEDMETYKEYYGLNEDEEE